MPSVLPVVLGGLIALGCLIVALSFLRRKRLIEDLPTSKTQGVFIGLVELKGTAESERLLTSYLTEIPCVQYAWQIEEHWSRTETETYRGRPRPYPNPYGKQLDAGGQRRQVLPILSPG